MEQPSNRRPVVASSLQGKRIAVPETRSLDVFCRLLEERGARVLRCPLVAILDAPDPEPVARWCDRLVAGSFDTVIWLTGEGLRRTMKVVHRTNPVLEEAFVRQLGQCFNVCRGPKPARELRALRITPSRVVSPPTTAGVIQALQDHALAGQHVGVQLYGDNPNTPLMQWLEQAGALADCVAPYVYADKASEQDVLGLIDALVDGQVDAIALTSAPQLRYLFRVARKYERDAALKTALMQTCVASVGPVVTASLAEAGITATVQPESQFFLKPLTRALERYFAGR